MVPDFCMGDVSVDLDLDELIETKAMTESRRAIFTEEEYASASATMDAEIAAARARGEVESGKASLPSAVASTGSPSPTTSG